jgi:DNA repair photolyase
MNIKTIHTQKALSPTQISLADYVINPYRGCEFGCVYCYSQENKNTKVSFFDTVGVKINIAEVLEKELRYTKPDRVLLGSTTECFQYQESNFRLTQQVLTILTQYQVAYTILTKSHLIAEQLPLIAQGKRNKIYFTFNCANSNTIRALERKSPDLTHRRTVIKKILDHGIDLRVHIGPYIPYLSDIDEIMELLPRAIKEIGIEVYHHSMGNFNDFLASVCSMDTASVTKIKDVYQNEKNYLKFTRDLKQRLLQIKEKNGINIFYIVPEYNTFYTSGIDYAQSL